jgi:hypothetical protein
MVVDYIQSFFHHPAVKVNSICREIIGDYQCRVQCNRLTTDNIFCIRHIVEKKWDYSESVHQLFLDFRKAYASVR